MSYVTGYVIPVPEGSKDEYMKAAEIMGALMLKYGATRVVENWGASVPDGKNTSFPLAVKKEDGEVVVFSWAEWPSKEVSDKAEALMMEDPDMENVPMPFDGTRLIFGGFETIYDKRA